MTTTFEAIGIANSALSIIEIGGLSCAALTDRKAVAACLRAACPDNGCFYVVDLHQACQHRLS
jgi:isopenicillin N synthase-like dioxygenase